MEKINWKNGKTPINQTNLNGMQNNIEKSCVAISPTQPTSNESIWIKKGKNLVNGVTLGDVGNCSVGNVPTYDAQIKNRVTLKSLFLEIIGGATISASITSGYQFAIYVCDKNRQILIAPTEYTYPSITTELSSNSKYLCVKIKKDDGTDITNADLESIQFQIEYREEPTDFEEFIEEKILIKNNAGVFEEYSDVVVSPVKPAQGKVWIKKGKNLFNKSTAPILNTYVQTSDNTFVGGYAATRSTYIEIEPNTTYTISKQAGKTFRVATCTDTPVSGGKILSTTANHTGTEITITTEANAKYLFINYYNTDNGDTAGEDVIKDSILIEQGSTATTYEDYIEKEIYVKNDNGVFERFYKEEKIQSITVKGTPDTNGFLVTGLDCNNFIVGISKTSTSGFFAPYNESTENRLTVNCKNWNGTAITKEVTLTVHYMTL